MWGWGRGGGGDLPKNRRHIYNCGLSTLVRFPFPGFHGQHLMWSNAKESRPSKVTGFSQCGLASRGGGRGVRQPEPDDLPFELLAKKKKQAFLPTAVLKAGCGRLLTLQHKDAHPQLLVAAGRNGPAKALTLLPGLLTQRQRSSSVHVRGRRKGR